MSSNSFPVNASSYSNFTHSCHFHCKENVGIYGDNWRQKRSIDIILTEDLPTKLVQDYFLR